MKPFVRRKDIEHLIEIILIVRPQINDAAGRQRLPCERGEAFVDQAKLPVLLLRPRIGKINVQRPRAARRQKKLQQIRALDADAAHVGEIQAATLAIHLVDAAHETFHAEEVGLWIQPRVFDEERGVAAAKFHLQRLGHGKEFRDVHPFEDGFKLVNERRRACCSRFFHAPSVTRRGSREQRRAFLKPPRSARANGVSPCFTSLNGWLTSPRIS